LLEGEGARAATDDEAGRDRHYLPDMPDEDPYQAGHRTVRGVGPAIDTAGCSRRPAPTPCWPLASRLRPACSGQLRTYLCTPYRCRGRTPRSQRRLGSLSWLAWAAGYEAMIRKGRHPGPYPNIIVMAGDGSAADIGLGSMSGALYRNHDALFICYGHECYREHRNPGVPTHALRGLTTFTPTGKANTAASSCRQEPGQDDAEGHPHCYVATTTVGYPVDLINKTREGA